LAALIYYIFTSKHKICFIALYIHLYHFPTFHIDHNCKLDNRCKCVTNIHVSQANMNKCYNNNHYFDWNIMTSTNNCQTT